VGLRLKLVILTGLKPWFFVAESQAQLAELNIYAQKKHLKPMIDEQIFCYPKAIGKVSQKGRQNGKTRTNRKRSG
jgi:hypothetical protein